MNDVPPAAQPPSRTQGKAATPQQGATAIDGSGTRRGWSINPRAWLAGVGVLIGLAVLAAFLFWLDSETKGEGTCFKQGKSNLAARKAPLWSLRAPGKPIKVALDDYVGEARSSSTFAAARPTKLNRSKRPVPPTVRIGAFVRGGSLSDGSRDIGFAVVARASRAQDGRAVDVEICARRSGDRSDSRPGRYTGSVRVAGPRVAPIDVPVEITIKGARTELVLFALVAAILGAAIGAANSKPAEDEAVQTKEKRGAHLALSLLPFGAGLLAGLAAAATVYFDDPTFGASRGADLAKLLAVTFGAATGGLAVTAPPARGLRNKLAQSTKSPQR